MTNNLKLSLVGLSLSLFLYGCGGGGNTPEQTFSTTSSPIISPPTSITSFTIDTTSTEINQTVTLSWETEHATSCSAVNDWQGTKPVKGKEEIYITQEKVHTFTLNCSGNGRVSRSITLVVDDPNTEGSCSNPHTDEFDPSFIGDFEIPNPQYVMPDSMIRSIGLKDYGVSWIYSNYKNHTNEAWLNNCSQEQYVRLMYRTTLRRIKELGAEQVTVYNFGYWENSQAEHWVLDHSTKHITDSQMRYIVETANSLGLEVRYVWQFLPEDRNNNFLFPFNGSVFVDLPLLKKIMDAHERNILQQAEFLQGIGVGSMSIDWSAMWLCFCGLDGSLAHNDPKIKEMKNYYMQRLSTIIDKAREVFSGDIYVGEGILWNDRRVVEKVDYVLISFPNLLSEQDNKNPSVELVSERVQDYLKNRYYEWYCLDQSPCWEYSSNQSIPVIINLFAQSTRNFLHTGWVEDGFCTPGYIDATYYDTCMQYDVDIDFSIQAIAIEGMLRGSFEQQFWTVMGTTTTAGYWLSDTLQPAPNQNDTRVIEGFPNISQSIRGKPAENIIKYWYSGKYEPYYM